MEAAHKKSDEALKAEFDKGKKVGENDESIKNKAKTKEDNKKANNHQQEIAKQVAKERKEEQEKTEEEHKTEVDKLSKEKKDVAAAAGMVREKLAQVESKVETLSEEKVVSSFVAASHSIAPAPSVTDSVLLGGWQRLLVLEKEKARENTKTLETQALQEVKAKLEVCTYIQMRTYMCL